MTIAYRRGQESMNASRYEQEFAQVRGVTVRYWSSPRRLLTRDGRVRAVEFETTRSANGGRLEGTGQTFVLDADVVFKAIGQKVLWERLAGTAELVDVKQDRIVVDEENLTTGCVGRRRLRPWRRRSDRVRRAGREARRPIHRQIPQAAEMTCGCTRARLMKWPI